MEEKTIDLLNSMPYVRHADVVDSTEHGYFIPWRVLYDFEMMFVLEGDITVEEQDKKYVLHKYDLHIMPPNVWHTRYVKENAYCKYFNLHFEFLDKNNDDPPHISVKELYIDPILNNEQKVVADKKLLGRSIYTLKGVDFPRTFSVHDSHEVISCFEALVRCFNKPDVFMEYQLRGMSTYLLGLLLEEMREKELSFTIDNVIDKFKRYVRTACEEKIDVQSFCKTYGYSYVYFRNKFKEKVGISPSAYAQNEKFAMAIEYLKSGHYTVTEVAKMVSFENTYHFSLQFKKKIGVNPGWFLPSRSKRETNAEK